MVNEPSEFAPLKFYYIINVTIFKIKSDLMNFDIFPNADLFMHMIYHPKLHYLEYFILNVILFFLSVRRKRLLPQCLFRKMFTELRYRFMDGIRLCFFFFF